MATLETRLKRLTHEQLLECAIEQRLCRKRHVLVAHETRLKPLTYGQLLECAVEQAHTCKARRITNQHLAKHTPLPEWAVTHVLLSADLLPHVIHTLGAADLSAMRVCRAWRACWRVTLEPRRILHPAGPSVAMQHPILALAALDAERLCVFENSTFAANLLNPQFEVQQRITSGLVPFKNSNWRLF